MRLQQHKANPLIWNNPHTESNCACSFRRFLYSSCFAKRLPIRDTQGLKPQSRWSWPDISYLDTANLNGKPQQQMKNLEGKIVLITGGASGIGKIMVRLMLARKAIVVIWDISQANIDETLSHFSNDKNLFGFKIDVSNIEQIQETAKRVKQEIGVVDVLINNAGIIVGKFFHEHSVADITKTMEINATGPMYIAGAFLQDMLDQNSGHICNIASSGGLISNPKMSVYAASKWALIGWSDSLRLEMKQLNKDVNLTTIMPYYINTGMFDGVQSRIPILDAEAAALTIVKAIEKNKKMITLPGYIYRLTRLGQAILSVNAFDWFAGKVLGIYNTMEHFVGRKQ